MVLAKKSKKCYRCDEILLAGAVPLCKATRNRELTEKKSSTAGSMALSDLLRNVGIGIAVQRAKNPDQLAKNVQEKFSIAARCSMNLKVLSKPGSTRAIRSLRKVETPWKFPQRIDTELQENKGYSTTNTRAKRT